MKTLCQEYNRKLKEKPENLLRMLDTLLTYLEFADTTALAIEVKNSEDPIQQQKGKRAGDNRRDESKARINWLKFEGAGGDCEQWQFLVGLLSRVQK